MSSLKTLIAVEADIASGIAIRYVCQLAKLTGVGLQTLHVVKPDEQGNSPGTGWVRQTWEDAITHKKRDKIAQLIREERGQCSGLGNPQMVVGEKDVEILHELQVSKYDFLTEGILHAFEPSNFLKKIHSRLYRNLPCPVLLVKNVVSLEKGVLALGEEEDLQSCASNFLKIFEGVPVDLDILCCNFKKTKATSGQEAIPREGGAMHDVKKMLAAKGRMPRESRFIQGTPQSMEGSVRDHGLLLVSLSRGNLKKTPMLDLLSRCPIPMLIDWR